MKKDKKNDLLEIFAGSSIDAEIVSSLLKNSKIETFLKDEIIGTLAPWQVSAGGAGAVKIIINCNDYKAAKLIVEEYKKNKN
jgi:Putative prokaryotic signal transducing protein